MGSGGGHHNYRQVDIRHNQLLRPARTSPECPRARLDAVDHPLLAWHWLEENSITRYDGIPRCLAESPQNLAHCAHVHFALFILYSALMRTDDRQYAARTATIQIDIQAGDCGVVGGLLVDIGNNGSPSRQRPLARNPFGCLQIVDAILLDRLSQLVTCPRAFASVLLKINSYFTLFRSHVRV
ncbi:MAG: hypothetical protein R3C12_00995 [Planctomycetaceae bacterium]